MSRATGHNVELLHVIGGERPESLATTRCIVSRHKHDSLNHIWSGVICEDIHSLVREGGHEGGDLFNLGQVQLVLEE